jgi:hypothetical protein
MVAHLHPVWLVVQAVAAVGKALLVLGIHRQRPQAKAIMEKMVLVAQVFLVLVAVLVLLLLIEPVVQGLHLAYLEQAYTTPEAVVGAGLIPLVVLGALAAVGLAV